METQSPSASNTRKGAPQNVSADWRPASGIIDRMLAYRDWWNIPEGRGRPGQSRDRARPRPQTGRETASGT